MKLLHVVPTYFPAVRYGGPIVSVHGLCASLAKRGHEVHVFTTNVDGDGTLDVPIDGPVAQDGVFVHYFPSEFRRVYWSRAMRAALRKDVAQFDFVHVHAVFLWPGTAAAREARRQRIPYLVSPRGMLVPELFKKRSGAAKRAWLELFGRRDLAAAAGIHFTSESEMDDCRRLGVAIERGVVVPNGVDAPPPPEVPRDETLLLHLGRISWKKRLDLVIRHLPAVPTARFVIAGNDEEDLTPRLQTLARTLSVADRVTFSPPVFGDEKWELLARAALFVLMSDSENFGNAVVEALAMETPVVLSSGVGVSSEVVAAGAGAIGLEQIQRLLADPELRREMGHRGRALVESRFGWDGIAQSMEGLYDSLVSRRE
ncbi:MAG: glycosyltransferase [Thermoanaerobaculia bacterium]